MSSKHQYFKFFFEWDELFEELKKAENRAKLRVILISNYF